MNLYKIYSALFMISTVIAVLGLIGAIVSFFMFDIKTIYKIRSGKDRRSSVKESGEQYVSADTAGQDRDSSASVSGKKNRPASFRTKAESSQPEVQAAVRPSLQLAAASAEPADDIPDQVMTGETTILENKVKSVHANDAKIAREPVQTPGFKFSMIEDTVITHTDEVVF